MDVSSKSMLYSYFSLSTFTPSNLILANSHWHRVSIFTDNFWTRKDRRLSFNFRKEAIAHLESEVSDKDTEYDFDFRYCKQPSYANTRAASEG